MRVAIGLTAITGARLPPGACAFEALRAWYYVSRITYHVFNKLQSLYVIRNTEYALALENTSFYSAGQNRPRPQVLFA